MLEAQRLSVKNWERIKNGDGNSLVTYSYQNACNKELDWIRTVHTLLARNGLQYRISDGSSDVCNALMGKTKDIFHQEAFAQVADPKSKLRTYGLIKENIGREDYL